MRLSARILRLPQVHQHILYQHLIAQPRDKAEHVMPGSRVVALFHVEGKDVVAGVVCQALLTVFVGYRRLKLAGIPQKGGMEAIRIKPVKENSG
jgi:hypothetical protein